LVRKDFVIGTAGHVDHGKSLLVKALTGIDPDRLPEEKARYMTIELGFAHLIFPDGTRVGIVDVPGHSRYVHNMAIGVHGLDAALLVVAADEGIMPQTLEHLQILKLMNVTKLIPVITKIDLATQEIIDSVCADVLDTLNAYGITLKSCVRVSAVTGQGVENLKSEILSLVSSIKEYPYKGYARLPIDRVFTIAGLGTVVTGTLVDNSFKEGDEVEIVPTGLTGKIRGIQQYGTPTKEASPRSRTALNIAGIPHSQISRGMVVVPKGACIPSTRFDAIYLHVNNQRDLKNSSKIICFVGAAEIPARVIYLDNSVSSDIIRFIRIELEQGTAAKRDDRYIIRSAAKDTTLGGGIIIDPYPNRRYSQSRQLLSLYKQIAQGKHEYHILVELSKGQLWAELNTLSNAIPIDQPVLESHISKLSAENLIKIIANHYIVSAETTEQIKQRVLTLIAKTPQASIDAGRLRQLLSVPAPVVKHILNELETAGFVTVEGNAVKTINLRQYLPKSAEELMNKIASYGLNVPSLSELITDQKQKHDFNLLVQKGYVVRLSQQIAVDKNTYEQAKAKIIEFLKERGQATVAEIRDILGSTRRPVIALLEKLDAEKVTLRVNDKRILRHR